MNDGPEVGIEAVEGVDGGHGGAVVGRGVVLGSGEEDGA